MHLIGSNLLVCRPCNRCCWQPGYTSWGAPHRYYKGRGTPGPPGVFELGSHCFQVCWLLGEQTTLSWVLDARGLSQVVDLRPQFQRMSATHDVYHVALHDFAVHLVHILTTAALFGLLRRDFKAFSTFKTGYRSRLQHLTPQHLGFCS